MSFSMNGTTISFGGGGDEAELVSVSRSTTGNEIDITVLQDTEHKYLVGIPDNEITATVVGHIAESVGDTGSLTIDWNDGETDNLGTLVITNIESSGDLDGRIETSVTYKPYGG